MKISGIVGVIVVAILIVASIILGNLFFTHILGVNVSSLPPFFKFIVHISGAAMLLFIIKKVFVR